MAKRAKLPPSKNKGGGPYAPLLKIKKRALGDWVPGASLRLGEGAAWPPSPFVISARGWAPRSLNGPKKEGSMPSLKN